MQCDGCATMRWSARVLLLGGATEGVGPRAGRERDSAGQNHMEPTRLRNLITRRGWGVGGLLGRCGNVGRSGEGLEGGVVAGGRSGWRPGGVTVPASTNNDDDDNQDNHPISPPRCPNGDPRAYQTLKLGYQTSPQIAKAQNH